MFIDGPVVLSKRVYLSPILGPRSLGERGKALHPAPLLACRGAAVYGHMVGVRL